MKKIDNKFNIPYKVLLNSYKIETENRIREYSDSLQSEICDIQVKIYEVEKLREEIRDSVQSGMLDIRDKNDDLDKLREEFNNLPTYIGQIRGSRQATDILYEHFPELRIGERK
jgi:chromosome segregation ATPase